MRIAVLLAIGLVHCTAAWAGGTASNGKEIWLNLSNAITIEWFDGNPGYSSIRFLDDKRVSVREQPDNLINSALAQGAFQN